MLDDTRDRLKSAYQGLEQYRAAHEIHWFPSESDHAEQTALKWRAAARMRMYSGMLSNIDLILKDIQSVHRSPSVCIKQP
mmetsp:Transcript_40776/g.63661  ORF Transcript_40776/g.63661 Transcript_40776/m.63661 type:complete len:80 (-) Transcript_40776:94-333(-)